MVNDKMLEHLSNTIDEFVGDNPEQQNYADEYFRKLSVVNLQNAETGELRKVKEYYVLVPFEPTEDYAGMDSSELAIVAKDGNEKSAFTNTRVLVSSRCDVIILE